ncbi:MAG: UDP-glucose 4-epimerase GalE, partial [Spirochaetales bacterium]|nr:UDP-glucose 4-epimerase GalE [Spirochaetales bacterium]
IVVFDNLSSGQRVNLFAEERFVLGDIMNTGDLLACAKEGFDALIHLAAFKAAGESMDKPGKYAVNNICGTINILNTAVSAGIRRIVFSSSAAVYGEPEYQPIDEKHPTNPENFYGFTKLEVERFLRWYEKLKEIRFAALRYFNAAGYDRDGRIGGLEQNPANLLPVIMEVAAGKREKLQIYGDDYDTPDGTGVRDYVHVSDLATGHLAALEYISSKNKSLIVNLGSESGISVRQMVETARKMTGRPIPETVTARRPGDPAYLVSSAGLAKELLGWTAKQSDVESLVSTSWEAYRRAL